MPTRERVVVALDADFNAGGAGFLTHSLYVFTLIFSVYITEIDQEKGQQELLKSIETFSPEKLNPTSTEEKNPLPTKEVIDAEKQAQA